MNIIKNQRYGLLAAICVVLAIFVSFVSFAHANPSFFAPQAMTATATSTLSFMTPGAATTTFMYDSFGINGTNQPILNDPTGADSAGLMLQLTGSTTPANSATYATTTYNIVFEYSQDGVDWFSEAQAPNATSSPTVTIIKPISRNITLGATSLGGSGLATTTPTRELLTVLTPTRYTRVVISIPAGSTNGAVWGTFVPKKQNR